MNILEFNHLTFDEKCENIATEGRYLSFRYIENMKIYLYAIDDFFVEISFSPYHHKVVGIDAFNNVDLLNPYLEFVNIDQLAF
ncbi:MAG: hypothetical protein ACNS60_02675 [Candidatus Cyclobacteriaceae bacterium M2_1C_046]